MPACEREAADAAELRAMEMSSMPNLQNPPFPVLPHIHFLADDKYPAYYPPGDSRRDDSRYVYVHYFAQPVPAGAVKDRESHGRIYAHVGQIMAKPGAVKGWSDLCRYCARPLRYNEVIAGPSRDRGSMGKPMQYWHEDCDRPFGAIHGAHIPYSQHAVPTRHQNTVHDPFWHGDTDTQQSDDSQRDSTADDSRGDSHDNESGSAADTNDQAALDALTDRIVGAINDKLRAEFAASQAAQNAKIAELERQRAQDQDRIAELENARQERSQHVTHWLRGEDVTRRLSEGLRHQSYDLLLRTALGTTRGTYRQWWLKGPAGTGKTTAASMLANDLALALGKTLGTDFHFVASGTVSSQYELQGFRDIHGTLHLHEMFRAWTEGGVIIFDEFAGNPRDVVLWLNGGLSADGWLQFCHGMFKRHPLCFCLAADNTWGYGGDALYDRNPVDQSSLNRFQKIHWPADERLEHAMTGTGQMVVDWVDAVQATRKLINDGEAQVLISPRQMVVGEMQIESARLTAAEIVHVCCADLMSTDTWAQFGQPILAWQAKYSAEIDRRIAAREAAARDQYMQNVICEQIAGVN
jgi:hypothetical protein